MAYQALYRKYRPSNFDEVVGQQHIIQTLKNAIYQNRIAHAYLFCGPRGTGKTSIAKIFARMLNCTDKKTKPCGQCLNCQTSFAGNHPDIIEIDAASNNGVDEVRNLIDKVKYAPLHGTFKVYIIDEVHMMSQGAFNALLKTIEEPPEHVIFIFATTEPNKVIPTIISRCQRFDFSKVSDEDIIKRLKVVCASEKIDIELEALELIAKLADGGMRDSLSILDQCVAYCISKITVDDVRSIYGVLNTQDLSDLFIYIYRNNVDQLMTALQNYANKGVDLKRMFSDLMNLIKESIIVDYSPKTTLVSLSHKSIIEKDMLISNVNTRLSLLDSMMDTYSKFTYASNILDYIQTCFLSFISKSYEPENKIHNVNSYIKEEKNMNTSTFKSYENNSSQSDISDKPAKISQYLDDNQDKVVSDVSRETFIEEEKEDNKIILNDEYLLQLLVGANK
ncbi:MAG: DNA polymerase III subunit gamma/tau, partial [Holdemanella sp.]|nr:DNA polymerase III subunit gamma/tau [Holdemanella sp.]